jgi:hypothetical protein
MAYRDPTYVIFDGDKDQCAYRYMRGWKALENVDFDFRDAHDLTTMTSGAANEAYVKSQLRDRMSKARQVILLLGESTKYLRKFVAWEIDLAKEKDLPIIVVNLKTGQRRLDADLCPASLRYQCAVHVEFRMKIIQHALDSFPSRYRSFSSHTKAEGGRYYSDDVYKSLGL